MVSTKPCDHVIFELPGGVLVHITSSLDYAETIEKLRIFPYEHNEQQELNGLEQFCKSVAGRIHPA